MPLPFRKGSEARRTDDPGLATAFDRPLDRLMSKDGSFRVDRVGRLTGPSERPSKVSSARRGRGAPAAGPCRCKSIGRRRGYMQPVITRHSYRYDELVWGGRYVRAYGVENGQARRYLSQLSDHTPEPAPERLPS